MVENDPLKSSDTKKGYQNSLGISNLKSKQKMSESKAIDVNTKWDSYLDLGVRRFVYSSATGALAGLFLFRSPVTRWASIAFGAGVGIGSAYSDCSQKFEGDETIVSKNA